MKLRRRKSRALVKNTGIFFGAAAVLGALWVVRRMVPEFLRYARMHRM
jgi:hypothetical protein